MNDLDSALDDIVRIREQLAASSRFQGLAPSMVALTGILALLLSGWQLATGANDFVAWILLAVISALAIGTEAVARARRLHRTMADRLLETTLRRFLPTVTAGAVIGLVLLLRAPEHTRLLPGLWQLLVGVGVFAVLGNLPRQMVIAGGFYFAAGTACLVLAETTVPAALLMGLPFGIGQLIAAAILHFASTGNPHVPQV